MFRMTAAVTKGLHRNRMVNPTSVACLIAFAMLPMLTWAGSKDDAASAAANRAIRDVLRTEMLPEALPANRLTALQSILDAAPDHPATRWQVGQVQNGKQWQAFETTVMNDADDARMADYRQRRNDAEKNYGGQLELANWCRKQKLSEHERAHLVQSLLLATPNQDVSRIYERLGYQRIGSEWVGREELAELERQAKAMKASRERWSPRLQPLASKLDGTIPQIRQAKEQLDQIMDVRAIPAIEAVLCTQSQFAATTAVERLARMEGYQASQALARQAVFSPWLSVRQVACEHLRTRRFEDFVPDLLLLMYTPFESNLRFVISPRGAFWIDWWVARDGRDDLQQYHLRHNDGIYYWIGQWQPQWRRGIRDRKIMETFRDSPQVLERRRIDLTRNLGDMTYASQRRIDEIDEASSFLNHRITAALAEISNVSDGKASSDAPFWWQWWYDYTGYQQEGKRVVLVNEGNGGALPIIRGSCLVAGTPVWTEHGLAPIEQLRVGDRVLAKDIETGELVYKPVLHTTVRPPSPTFVFTVGDDSITASLGHNFWVSGAGWTKTRELRDGQPLHTATGMTRVSHVESAAEEKTYNLVVADFHTYFVGRSHILSHDVLPPRPTNKLVPGLVDE